MNLTVRSKNMKYQPSHENLDNNHSHLRPRLGKLHPLHSLHLDPPRRNHATPKHFKGRTDYKINSSITFLLLSRDRLFLRYMLLIYVVPNHDTYFESTFWTRRKSIKLESPKGSGPCWPRSALWVIHIIMASKCGFTAHKLGFCYTKLLLLSISTWISYCRHF